MYGRIPDAMAKDILDVRDKKISLRREQWKYWNWLEKQGTRYWRVEDRMLKKNLELWTRQRLLAKPGKAAGK